MCRNYNVLKMSFILLIIFIPFFLTGCSKEQSIKKQDAELKNIVIDNEKNLILLQLRKISFNEYEERMKPMLHSYYKESYLKKIESDIKHGAFVTLSTKTPVYHEISKVYSDSKGETKTVFDKLPVDDSTSEIYKKYIFKKDEESWRILQVTQHYVVINNDNDPNTYKAIEAFTSYEGNTIEYTSVRVMEKSY